MKPIDTNHQQKRTVLRVVGVILLISGLILIGIALIDFFSVFTGGFSNDPFSGPGMRGPSKFGLFFLGMPLTFVGAVMSGAGFMGAAARYQAEEIAPVGKDTINYMVDGTKDSIKEVSKAIHEGMQESKGNTGAVNIAGNESVIYCSKCGKDNESAAMYCNACGSKIAR